MSLPPIPTYTATGTAVGYMGGTGPFGLPLYRRPGGVVERVWTIRQLPAPAGEVVLTEDSPRPALAGVVTGP
jgi:hypothetical protein